MTQEKCEERGPAACLMSPKSSEACEYCKSAGRKSQSFVAVTAVKTRLFSSQKLEQIRSSFHIGTCFLVTWVNRQMSHL